MVGWGVNSAQQVTLCDSAKEIFLVFFHGEKEFKLVLFHSCLSYFIGKALFIRIRVCLSCKIPVIVRFNLGNVASL